MKIWVYFTNPGLVERMQHYSHLPQELVYSLEQVELTGLVRRYFVMMEKVKQLTGMYWS